MKAPLPKRKRMELARNYLHDNAARLYGDLKK